jgi:hypothetical protein
LARVVLVAMISGTAGAMCKAFCFHGNHDSGADVEDCLLSISSN